MFPPVAVQKFQQLSSQIAGALGWREEVVETDLLILSLGLLFWALELVLQLTLRPYFENLLKNNPKTSPKGRKATAVQAVPRAVCFIHNAVQLPLALLILTDPVFYHNRVYQETAFSHTVMLISAGYFLYDSFECLVRLEHEGVEFLTHGVFCFVTYAGLCHLPILHFYGAGFLMWELSTPFVHLRWFLYKMGRASQPLYFYTAVGMITMFFACRNVWGPIHSGFYIYDAVQDQKHPGGPSIPLAMLRFSAIALVVLNGLNFYWFIKMAQLALGHFGTGPSKAVPSPHATAVVEKVEGEKKGR